MPPAPREQPPPASGTGRESSLPPTRVATRRPRPTQQWRRTEPGWSGVQAALLRTRRLSGLESPPPRPSVSGLGGRARCLPKQVLEAGGDSLAVVVRHHVAPAALPEAACQLGIGRELLDRRAYRI